MLALYPKADLCENTFRRKNADYRAEGEKFDQKLRLVSRIVKNGTKPGVRSCFVNSLLFIAGKMKHTAFQCIAFICNADPDRFTGVFLKAWSIPVEPSGRRMF